MNHAGALYEFGEEGQALSRHPRDDRHRDTIAADQANWERLMGGQSPRDEVAAHGGHITRPQRSEPPTAEIIAAQIILDDGLGNRHAGTLTEQEILDLRDSLARTLRYEGGAR